MLSDGGRYSRRHLTNSLKLVAVPTGYLTIDLANTLYEPIGGAGGGTGGGTVPSNYLTLAAGDARYLQSFSVPAEYLTQTECDARYLLTVPAEYLTETEGDARYLLTVPAEYLTKTDGDTRYLQSVPAEYLTETAGDARYLLTVPAEYLTETEGDARYLQSVPAEYLTQTEGDSRYLLTVPAEYLTQTAGDARYLRTVPAEYLTETAGDARYLQSFTVPAEYLTQTEGDARYGGYIRPLINPNLGYIVMHQNAGFYDIIFATSTQPAGADYTIMLTAETTSLGDKYNLAYLFKQNTGFTVVSKDRNMAQGSSAVFTAPDYGMSLKDLGFDFLCVRKGVTFCHGSIARDGTIRS